MNANQYISLLLLIGRLLTVYIMLFVIRKQWRTLRSKRYPELKRLRRTLLTGSIIIMAANFIPITIDTFGLFNRGSYLLLLVYVFSNNLTTMFTAYMLWYNLRLAEKIKLENETSV